MNCMFKIFDTLKFLPWPRVLQVSEQLPQDTALLDDAYPFVERVTGNGKHKIVLNCINSKLSNDLDPFI